MNETDLVIVGAGPAGLAAVDALSSCAISITVIDEQARPGGQIFRQPPAAFKVPGWLSARRYNQGKRLIQRGVGAANVTWLMPATVLGISPEDVAEQSGRHKVVCATEFGTQEIIARCVLIAPGCYDMPVMFPGWTLPGVMATGGIQAFVKSQQIIPGERTLFVGTHPLQLIVADQIVQAGGEVAGVVFAQSFTRVFGALSAPLAMLRQIDKIAQIGGAIGRLKLAGVPIRFGATVVRADGGDVLEHAMIAPIDAGGNVRDAQPTSVACDRLGLCFGFLASSELARQRGASFVWSSRAGGWIIEHDEWMSTEVSGLFVAGEITGVAGADVAQAEGHIAGIGCAVALGCMGLQEATRTSKAIRRRLGQLRRFADILRDLSWPGKHLLLQMARSAGTLCRCESITISELEACFENDNNPGSSSAVKLISRVGMGLCQGRYCNYMLTRLLAQRLQVSEQTLQPFSSNFPAKPVRIGALIAPDTSSSGD